MKNLLALVLMIGFSVAVFGQEIQLLEACKDESFIHKCEMEHATLLLQNSRNTRTLDYDVKYHRLEWTVDPSVNYINGVVTTYFVPTKADFTELNFDFASNMQVDQVSYHGTDLTGFSLADNNLSIPLGATLNQGTLDSISVHYQGSPQGSGFGSFEVNTHDGVPVMWTLSEPFGAQSWWPCKQDLNDKIDSIDIHVRVPNGNLAGSNGLLLSSTDMADNTVVHHWRHRYPIPAYLISLAVTNYEQFEDYVELSSGDSVYVLTYIFPEDRDDYIENGQHIEDQLILFSDLFGDYPFKKEKYGHAQFGWGGGMEHQTMSSMGNLDYSLQAHELAHQWFGDKITCGSWEDIWLNEGFASYLTALTYEKLLAGSGNWEYWKSRRREQITSRTNGSVKVDDTTSVNRIFSSRLTYYKGAFLLHMLRWKLGDEDFFNGIRNYINDERLEFSYAKTPDLIAHMEAESGMELDEFFADWYAGEGYPSYHFEWGSDKHGMAIIRVRQDQSDPSVAYFEMPLPIRLYLSDGTDTLIRIEHEFDNQEFVIPLQAQVDSFVFDPDVWLLSKDNTITEVPVSIDEISNADGLYKIAPQPISNELQIHVLDGAQPLRSVRLMSIDGKTTLDFEAQSSGIYDVSSLPSGAYAIMLQDDKQAWFSSKVIKY